MPDYGTNSQPGDPGHAAIHRAVGARLDQLTDENLAATIGAVVAESGGGRRTWEQAFAAPAADDEPTITVSTSLPTGDLILPARVGGGSTGAPDVDFDPAFRYNGGPGADEIDATWIGPSASEAGVAYLLHPEFVTARGNDEFWVKVYTSSTTLGIRLVIDGLWHTLELERFTVTSATAYYVHVSFPTARARSIRFESIGTSRFGGVIVPTGETVTRPSRPIEKSVIFIWDSYGGGASTPPDGATRLETVPNFVAQLLGADKFVNMSIGGTGWDPDESNNFTERFPFAIAQSPHIIIVPASRNDVTDADDVYEAALPGMAELADIPVVYTFSSPLSTFSAVSDAVRDASAAAGRPYREVYGSSVGLGTDGIHPTFASHQSIAAAMYAAMDVPAMDRTVAGIVKASTAVTLDVSPAEIAEFAADVTLTATVSPQTAGVVRFRDGNTVIGQALVTGGEAVLVVDALALGAHSLSARFEPADTFRYRAGTSPTVSLTILEDVLTDIITTNLLAEITVDALSLTPGDQIASLTPPRGAHTDALTQATSGSQPYYVLDSDGAPAIQCSGNRSLTAPTWTSPPSAGQVTLFLVYRVASIGSGAALYLTDGPSSTNRIRYQLAATTGSRALAVNGGSTVAFPSQPASDTTWRVECIVFETAGQVDSWFTSLSDPTVQVAGAFTLPNPGGFRFGNVGGGGSGWDVRFRAILPYTGAMTDGQIRSMLHYLGTEYGATLS